MSSKLEITIENWSPMKAELSINWVFKPSDLWYIVAEVLPNLMKQVVLQAVKKSHPDSCKHQKETICRTVLMEWAKNLLSFNDEELDEQSDSD